MRSEKRPARQAAWVLTVPLNTLLAWNQGFDERLKPLMVPDQRGKAAKVTVDLVRRIIEHAKAYPGRRIRLKRLGAELKQVGIELGAKTLEAILIANDLYKARTRHKRPRFYQSLCQQFPNGLLSIDGSQIVVWLGKKPYPFNVELAVDVGTFAHTAFGVTDSETAAAVIGVLESHRSAWGLPVGVLSDRRSGNCSEAVQQYLDQWGVKAVPAGPGNPKGNGSDEGAFGHMKKALGRICMDTSSSRALARSILEALVSVYVSMRNRLCACGRMITPDQHMRTPVSDAQKDADRQRLNRHVAAKVDGEENRLKLDRLDWVIEHYGLDVATDVRKHAQRSIKGYTFEAIRQTETAFLKATQRNPGRRNLSYFFGILRNIQQKLDDDTKSAYCRRRYNYEVMLGLERQKHELAKPISIDYITGMLTTAVTIKARSVKALAVRKAREWTHELLASCGYVLPIKRKVEASLSKLTGLSIGQKEEAWKLFCQFLNTSNPEGRVTLFA